MSPLTVRPPTVFRSTGPTKAAEIAIGKTLSPQAGWGGYMLARFGVRREFSARFGAAFGSLPGENLDAEAFQFGGGGRNRTSNTA